MAASWVLALGMPCALIGCGGGNGSGGGRLTRVQLDITWAARSRELKGPGSALSATVTLKGARPRSGDLTFTVERDAPLPEHTVHYVSPTVVVTGAWPLTVNFYAQHSGAGGVVAVASAVVTIAPDGSGIGNVTTTGTLQALAPGTVTPAIFTPAGSPEYHTVVGVGFSAQVPISAYDTAGNLIALTPGSAFFKPSAAADTALIGITPDGIVTGQSPGQAAITATVDGLSESDLVTVIPAGAVDIVSAPGYVTRVPGQPAYVPTGGSVQLQAYVAASNPAVTWSIAEGAVGGSITQPGVYTPSDVRGAFHIIATSQADPTQSSIVQVIHDYAGDYNFRYGVVPGPSIAVPPGGNAQLTAALAGPDYPPPDGGWTIAEGAAGGAVDQSGNYTAPSTPGTYHAVASYLAGPPQAYLTIYVEAGSFRVWPAVAYFGMGQMPWRFGEFQFHADRNVTWSVQEGDAGGQIDSNGNYIPPTIPSLAAPDGNTVIPNTIGPFHVVATNPADGTTKVIPVYVFPMRHKAFI